MKVMERFGFQTVAEAVPWRSVLAEPTPGQALKGARTKEGLTQRALSELTGIPQRHLSEMENDRRPIGKKTALTFADVLKVDRRVFL